MRAIKKLGINPVLLKIFMVVAAIGASAALTSCVDDDDNYNARWYLSGTWQCLQYPEETLCFFPDGTGHWQNNYNGDYEDFDYYCNGGYIYFQWYPMYGPSYTETCMISVTNNNAMQITYPSDSGWGAQTLYYSRL